MIRLESKSDDYNNNRRKKYAIDQIRLQTRATGWVFVFNYIKRLFLQDYTTINSTPNRGPSWLVILEGWLLIVVNVMLKK